MLRLKGSLICCASLALLFLASRPSVGALTCGDQVRVSAFVPQTSGDWIDSDGTQDHSSGMFYAGEYLITNTATGDSFKTFCLQLNVDILAYGDPNIAGDPSIANNDGLYTVSSISNTATGGSDIGVTPTEVTNATKWLWCNYYYGDPDGVLGNATAIDVQEAIWALQGDVGGSSLLQGITATAQTLVDLAMQNSDNIDPNISALNLISVDTGASGQSMLIMQPPEGVLLRGAPEPMSLVIWGGLSALGLVVAMRQRRSSLARAA